MGPGDGRIDSSGTNGSRTAFQIMIKGNELIAIVDTLRAQNKTATEICRECGYIKEDGKTAYTDFYTELLTAKGTINQPQSPEISDEYQEEYDSLIESYDQDAVDTFVELYGQECIESFQDSYRGEYDSEAEYAEEYYTGCYDVPAAIVVDWQATWDQNFSDDHTYQDGYVFFDQF
jgi:hypothetical protein